MPNPELPFERIHIDTSAAWDFESGREIVKTAILEWIRQTRRDISDLLFRGIDVDPNEEGDSRDYVHDINISEDHDISELFDRLPGEKGLIPSEIYSNPPYAISALPFPEIGTGTLHDPLGIPERETGELSGREVIVYDRNRLLEFVLDSSFIFKNSNTALRAVLASFVFEKFY